MRRNDRVSSFRPVLLRIVILVAVVMAVPAVLWTITVFMRTYVAQPVIPGARPLTTVSLASATGDVTSTASMPGIANSSPTTLAASAGDTRSDPPRDISAAPGNSHGVAPTVVAYASTAAPMTVQPALPPDKILAQTPPAPAPDVSASPGAATPSQAQPAEPPAPAAEADDLPAPDPLNGPVPLPPRRPAVFALAETGIPLPRARPAIAPEPVPAEEPSPGYDPGMTHY